MIRRPSRPTRARHAIMVTTTMTEILVPRKPRLTLRLRHILETTTPHSSFQSKEKYEERSERNSPTK